MSLWLEGIFATSIYSYGGLYRAGHHPSISTPRYWVMIMVMLNFLMEKT